MGKPVNRTLEIAAIGKDASGIGHVAGPVVSFRGNGDPLRSLVANIDPVQAGSGDPSPVNVRPISGWSAVNVWRTGKNLFDESVFANYGGTLLTSGVWHFDTLVGLLGKTLWTVPSTVGQITVTMWRKQNGVGNQGIRLVINYTDGSSVKVGNINSTGGTDVYTLTTDASKTVQDITGDYGSNQLSTDINVVICIGSTATAYEPYNGNEYTIQLGQTVYGGTLDVTNGVLTVDRAMVDLGTLKWSYSQAYGSVMRFLASNSGMKAVPSSEAANWKCSEYKIVSANDTWFGRRIGIADNGSSELAAYDPAYTDAATFKTAMSGVQLVYELATPVTIQLTPTEVTTLLGQNNIWADTGDVDVEYSAIGGPGGKLAILLRERRELLIALKMGMTQEEVGLLGSLPGVSLGGGLSPGIIRPGASAQDEDEEEEIL